MFFVNGVLWKVSGVWKVVFWLVKKWFSFF